jgi:hypothetical protein
LGQVGNVYYLKKKEECFGLTSPCALPPPPFPPPYNVGTTAYDIHEYFTTFSDERYYRKPTL